jgi:hypothetical protein
MRATTAAPTYAGDAVSWWLPFVGLAWSPRDRRTPPASWPAGGSARAGLVVALLEVVAAVAFAWLLLDQLPGPLQLVGGALIVAGVIVVKLAERPARADATDPRGVHEPDLPLAVGQTT